MGGEGETISGYLMAPGYGDWTPYGLDDIWEMVRYEDGKVNWSQYYSWQRMAQLCEEEADQLDKAVNQLVERWPDRPGSAAEAFKSFVGTLTASMRETAAAATVNADALYGLTAKLLAARAEIAALLQQRLGYIQAEQQMIEHTRAVSGLPNQPIQPPPPEPQRPPDNWAQYLDHRARNVMAETDAAIATDAARFQVPNRYDIVVDAPSPRPGQLLTPSPGAAFGESVLYPVPPQVSIPLPPGSNLPNNDSVDKEPTLDGGQSMPSPTNGSIAQVPPSAKSSTQQYTGIIGLPANRMRPGDGSGRPVSLPTATTSTPPGAITKASTNRTSVSGVQGLPFLPVQGQRANVAGETAVSPAGRPATPYARRRPRDPNDPWAAREGVPPIIQPSQEEIDHDPGPGVFGIDR